MREIKYLDVLGFIIQHYYLDNKNCKHGSFKQYYPESELLLSDDQYCHGQLHGKSIIYHDNGQINTECDFNHGVMHGSFKEYYSDGQLKQSGTYSYALKEGSWQYYLRNGFVSHTSFYSRGILNGAYLTYHEENGALSTITFFVSGKQEGLSQSFHPNGQLRENCNYSNGVVIGELKTYTQEGTLNKVLYYDANGNNITMEILKNYNIEKLSKEDKLLIKLKYGV